MREAVATAPPKRQVWSLIITFFGDAVLPRGGRVAARAVTEVMTRIGVEEGAVRTAFSRLVSDGWVERSREGRAAFYRLAEDGRAPFEEASRLIYAAPRRGAPELALAVAPPDLPAPTGASPLREGAFLFDRLDPGLEAALRGAGCLIVPTERVDDWPLWTGEGERAETRASCEALIDRFVLVGARNRSRRDRGAHGARPRLAAPGLAPPRGRVPAHRRPRRPLGRGAALRGGPVQTLASGERAVARRERSRGAGRDDGTAFRYGFPLIGLVL